MKRTAALAILCFCLLFHSPLVTSGNSDLEESKRKLLQTSLSIYEIDQELLRLTEMEDRLNRQIAETGQQISAQEQKVEITRKHAGHTLRALYTGERDSIWLWLLSAKTFSDLLVIYDYLSMIVEHDRYLLQNYAAAYNELRRLQEQLLKTEQELQETKANFLAQRERIIALEKEREEQLAKADDAELLRKQSEELVNRWANEGLPLFKSYFQALSEAILGLPKLLSDGSDRYLTISGRNATFELTDRQLNEFLRSENETLENLTFSFRENYMLIVGNEGDLEVEIKGRYALEELDGKKLILFHIDELLYDGYTLPDTTSKALEEEFFLGFDTQYFASFLEATGLRMEDGKLTVYLQWNWNL